MIRMENILRIVLVEPEIPPNTGNVARLSAALGAWLHLVRPLGFELDDKHLKRAGLDYWPDVRMTVHDDFRALQTALAGAPFYLATTKGERRHTDVAYEPGACLLVGSETRGLAADVLAAYPGRRIRLPMRAGCRSLNLGNAVAALAYEVMRQWDFPGLEYAGGPEDGRHIFSGGRGAGVRFYAAEQDRRLPDRGRRSAGRPPDSYAGRPPLGRSGDVRRFLACGPAAGRRERHGARPVFGRRDFADRRRI
jgi:tRNA (cytidine/uridine-2'-O-)-methyltransferase